MTYRIILSALAEEHLEYWSKCGNTAAKRKLSATFDKLEEHPMTGTGVSSHCKVMFRTLQ